MFCYWKNFYDYMLSLQNYVCRPRNIYKKNNKNLFLAFVIPMYKQ